VGDPLEKTQAQAEKGLEFAKKWRFGFVVDLISVQLALVRNLRGLTSSFGSFNYDEFDESRFEDHLKTNPVFALPGCWYFARKAQARFLAGNYESAVEASIKAQRAAWTSPSQFERVELYYYGALSHAACWERAQHIQKREHLDSLGSHYKMFELWAKRCAENFENRAALIGAEIARIEDRVLDAEALYEKAIRSAHANGFIHNEAIAYEVAARFYAARGLQKFADAYLLEACYCYRRWGADGKVAQLDHLYPHLTKERLKSTPRSTILAPAELLNLATVIKVSQATSGEMVLEKLINRVMRAAIEHAGAERGLLILPRGDELQLEAEITTSGNDVSVHRRNAPVTAAVLPEFVVRYVMRTREDVVLEDAIVDNPFSADAYIAQHRIRSILCLPLINQARLSGILYLENKLTSHAFTPDRITILKVLASQAAVSLENTRLYRDLEDRETRIRRLVDANILGVFIWNLDGAIIEANDAFLRITQHEREDLVSGRVRWTDLTPTEWREHDERALAELRATGSVQPYEKELFRKDGSRVPVLIAGALFEVAGSEGVAFALDLSEQKQQEAEREKLRQQLGHLAHLNRVSTMGELTASLAHEIKQPIGAAVTNAEACLRLLGRTTPDLQEAREAAVEMVKDARRAAAIIDRVRFLYQKGSPKRDIIDLNELIREMVIVLQNEANRRSITMRTDFAEGLPSTMGDRVQLQQALMNLMLNGMEAICDKSGQLIIQSQLAGDDEMLISVADTGVGLPAEDIDKIFHAFFTTKSQGTGLGLAITRSIVESHGGRIWATANSGRGTTFSFTLPIMIRL
jgi:PAS domain S-box-containing protein